MFETLITFQARQRPQALAIHTPAGDVSYAALDADVNRMARFLTPVLPQARSRVAVEVQNPAVHWLVLLALARLGHASASLPPITARPRAQLLAPIGPAFMISDREEASLAVSVFHLSPERVTQALRAAVEPVAPHRFADDEAVRIMQSSGTTGVPKTIVWTRAMLDRRLQTGALLTPLAGERSFIHEGVDTDGGFRGALLVWAVGGTILFAKDGFDWAELLRAERPDCIAIVPSKLARLLQALPQGFAPLPRLNVLVGGSPLPQALALRARTRLTPNIYVTYGSTEAGLVTMAPAHRLEGRPGAAGFATPWAEIEVVDDAGSPLPSGQAGRIRTRSEEMAQGYEGDAEMTRANFRDGWFYPGDVGVIEADGCLMVQGRVDEVMDINGFKVAPMPVEEVALASPGVRDAAAVALPDGEGRTRGFVAVQTGEGYAAEVLASRLRAEFPQVVLTPVELDAIPRSPRGKIERDKVRELVGAVLRGSRQAAPQPSSA